MKTKYILVLCAVLFAVAGYAQKEKKYVREGNQQYEEGNFSEAEVQYRKALDADPKYSKGKFNLGDAMYEQKNFDESGKIFNELTESNISKEAKSGAYYNMGNSFMSANKYQEAIDAYKQALLQNPDDQDAKYNLEYARKMLKEQQQQQQNQDQNKDQDKKDENKDQQDKKDEQNQDQNQKDDQQQQDQNKSDQNKDQQKQEQQPQQISKEDAQRMMEALKNDEKQTLQKLQEQKAKAVKAKSSEIDW